MCPHDSRTHFRIGILGGMGPEAGVLLQQLIVEATPAATDQEHLEVITYTNPHVPDRTISLQQDGGASYLEAVVESLRLLESVGVDVLAIACNTAHARFAEIQAAVNTPVLNMLELAKQEIMAVDGPVGILATDGTVRSRLFSITGHPEKTVTPSDEFQRDVMSVIRDIKAGVKDTSIVDRLVRASTTLQQSGCVKITLGCTELSLLHDPLRNGLGDIFIDPLRLAARALVKMPEGG
jgi:aspartate racemase